MTVHLFLNCPEIKTGDEITTVIAVHQYSKFAPDEVDCEACLARTYGHSPQIRSRR